MAQFRDDDYLKFSEHEALRRDPTAISRARAAKLFLTIVNNQITLPEHLRNGLQIIRDADMRQLPSIDKSLVNILKLLLKAQDKEMGEELTVLVFDKLPEIPVVDFVDDLPDDTPIGSDQVKYLDKAGLQEAIPVLVVGDARFLARFILAQRIKAKSEMPGNKPAPFASQYGVYLERYFRGHNAGVIGRESVPPRKGSVISATISDILSDIKKYEAKYPGTMNVDFWKAYQEYQEEMQLRTPEE